MSPHDWQEDAITPIITLANDNSCALLLLVLPMGGGKSALREMVGVILAGVILTISPLLSLAADQTNKVGSRASQEFGKVLSFPLDKIGDRNEQLAVATSILNMASETTQTVFLFASPQVFVNNPAWQKHLDLIVQKDVIIQKTLLQFIAVNEIHLFIHFACSFRQEFSWLQPYLFSKLQSCDSSLRTTVPVLFMTATCNKNILKNVKLLSGLKFHVTNIFWPPRLGMWHHNVTFDNCYSSPPLGIIQSCLKKLITTNNKSKFMIYSN
jgi:superfamily II DNA helicase RecQ